MMRPSNSIDMVTSNGHGMIHNLCTFISCYRVGRSEMLAKARVCNL